MEMEEEREMEGERTDQNWQKMIIAMKGQPFTGKTTLATALGWQFGCLVIFIDEILLSLSLKHHQSDHLYPLAFRIAYQTAKYQLQNNLSNVVVIDSPLSSQSQLDLLISLARNVPARLVIVECRPKNEFVWMTRFESEYKNTKYYHMWNKPKSWREVEAEPEFDADMSCFQDMVKLVLDPFVDIPFSELNLHTNPEPPAQKAPFFVEFVQTFGFCRLLNGQDRVEDFGKWIQTIQVIPPGLEAPIEATKAFCNNGHNFAVCVVEPGLTDEEINCLACEEQVTGKAYTCKNCKIALHKSCAELVKCRHFQDPQDYGFPNDTNQPYKFSKKYCCRSCEEDGNDFSYECELCIFVTQLKYSCLPVILKHKGHDHHFLTLRLMSIGTKDSEYYHCNACARSCGRVFYFCSICPLKYHPRCLLMPLEMVNLHGGHKHVVALEFFSEEAEDYLCRVCYELRDPEGWYYSCTECSYEVEMTCMLNEQSKLEDFALTYPDSLLEPSKEYGGGEDS